MFNKYAMQEGVTVYYRDTDQFKTVTFTIKWETTLTEEAVALHSVLANVLEDSTANYPTSSVFRQRQDELYGLQLYTNSSKRGGKLYFSIHASFVNREYIQDADLQDQAFAFIKEVIYQPNLVAGVFKDQIVEREKKTIIDRIKAQYDNKSSYAQKRLVDILRPNSAASIAVDGKIETIEAVTSEKLTAAYYKMINEYPVTIYLIGAIQEEEMLRQIQQTFQFKSTTRVSQQLAISTDKVHTEVTYVTEQQKMKQGKLHLGFSTPVLFSDEDYPAMQVMNGILGGFAHSKLFMNVREKESMAYYASSSYASHHGLLYINAGIEAELAPKAIALILEQLTAIQTGEISEKELNQTKALLKNSIRSSFDSARGQIEVYDQFKEWSESFKPEQLIEKWSQVTVYDVQRVANKLELEVIYLLSGTEVQLHETTTL